MNLEIPTLDNVKQFFEEIKIWHEEMLWKNSPERRELAVKRLSAFRSFTHQPPGGTLKNPYTHPEDYDFF